MNMRSSAIWNFFFEKPGKPSFAVCLACKQEITRGPVGKPSLWGNGGMTKHLQRSHPIMYKEYEAQSAMPKTSTNSQILNNHEDCYVLIDNANSSQKSQLTLSETIERKNKYLPGSNDQALLNHLLFEWLVSAALPYSTVSNERFSVFLNQLNFRYTMPSEKFLRTTLMPNIYDKVRNQIEQLIKDNTMWISATTDMWTSQSMQSYVSLTIHFINEWKRKTVILGCFNYTKESHSAKDIGDFLRNLIDEWKLNHKLHVFVRDNDRKLVNALNLNNFNNVGCFIHTLQLVVRKCILDQKSVSKLKVACSFNLTKFNNFI